jgi:hypothetical protein
MSSCAQLGEQQRQGPVEDFRHITRGNLVTEQVLDFP